MKIAQKFHVYAILAFFTLALSGCFTPPKSTVPNSSTPAWSGRLGLQVHDSLAEEKSFSASFHLQGSATRGFLEIFTPFGSQVAELQWEPDKAFLRQGSKVAQSTSLDELLYKVLGTALPIEALFDWLQGKSTAVDGWNINLENLDNGKITAQRNTPLPVTTLRIILQQPQ